MDKQYVDIIFCLPGERFSANFLTCWTKTLEYITSNSINWIYVNRYTPIVASTRNDMVRFLPGAYDGDPKNTIPFENKIIAKKIIFIDHDMIWSVLDIERLILSDKDIVGGFYKMQKLNENNINYLAARKNKKWLFEEDIKNKESPIELNGIGFGFIAIKFDVFNKIKFPWFETFDLFDEKENCVYNVSEDISFCMKATELGYKIYGDPKIKLGHEKLLTLDFQK